MLSEKNQREKDRNCMLSLICGILKKKKKKELMERKRVGVPIVAQWVKNGVSIHEDTGLIPGPVQRVKLLTLPQAVV